MSFGIFLSSCSITFSIWFIELKSAHNTLVFDPSFAHSLATSWSLSLFRAIKMQSELWLARFIARDLPKDKDDLLSIKGIGPKTLETYGDAILTIINN